jgi:hypothetical protein
LVVENNRDKRDLWIAFIIGLMIIGIAVFNYLGVLANKFHGKVKYYKTDQRHHAGSDYPFCASSS